MRVALVVYEGVSGEEVVAFRTVLELLRDVEIVTVGARRGRFAGLGAAPVAETTFGELWHADVVVVPGGIGCERAAGDGELRAFLLRMEHGARYVAASSTGSVLLASAGLLHGAPAATHWLAGDLLRRYGSEAAGRRMVVAGNVVTCEGAVSAVDAALALVERIEGPHAAKRARDTLIERGRPHLREPSWLARLAARLTARRPPAGGVPPAPPPGGPPVTPLSVMIELVEDEESVRRLRARARRSGRR